MYIQNLHSGHCRKIGCDFMKKLYIIYNYMYIYNYNYYNYYIIIYTHVYVYI